MHPWFNGKIFYEDKNIIKVFVKPGIINIKKSDNEESENVEKIQDIKNDTDTKTPSQLDIKNNVSDKEKNEEAVSMHTDSSLETEVSEKKLDKSSSETDVNEKKLDKTKNDGVTKPNTRKSNRTIKIKKYPSHLWLTGEESD